MDMYPISFLLRGQLPSGKNAVRNTRTGHRYPNQRFILWRTEALQQIGKVPQPFVGPVQVIVDYVPGDLRRRDVPGMLDALCHVLEKAGVVMDDAQVANVLWQTFAMDRQAPSCRVTVGRMG
jgi:Holliday junction resolvase RusA-like endonuclease